MGIEGEPIDTPGDVLLALERKNPGNKVRVTMNREGTKTDLDIVLDRSR